MTKAGRSDLESNVKVKGDIGTWNRNIRSFDKILGREHIPTPMRSMVPHEMRFTTNPNKMEVLSTVKRDPKVKFDKMARRLDLWESQFGEIRENARKKRPPSGLAVFYDNAKSKNSTLNRTDFIVPDFSRQVKLPLHKPHEPTVADPDMVVNSDKLVRRRKKN